MQDSRIPETMVESKKKVFNYAINEVFNYNSFTVCYKKSEGFKLLYDIIIKQKDKVIQIFGLCHLFSNLKLIQ